MGVVLVCGGEAAAAARRIAAAWWVHTSPASSLQPTMLLLRVLTLQEKRVYKTVLPATI